MQVSPAASAVAASASDTATKSLNENFDNFLTMLTTQLQYQDPLSPTDTTEFTNQLVQFSQLEQQIKQSKQTEDLIALQQASETMTALGYLGKEIEISTGIALLKDGTTKFDYVMPPGAAEAKITIFNEAGEIVASLPAETDAGRHTKSWDGKNGAGLQLTDGIYSVLVTATDAEKDLLGEIPIFFRGLADGVTRQDGTTHLSIGPIEVPLDRVTSAHTPAA